MSRKNHFEFDAVFPSSLHPWKGTNRILDLIKQARLQSPTLKFSGLNRGGDVESALNLGIYLAKTQNRRLFQKFIARSDIALGQGFGLIGSADIESIQLGLRFFPLAANSYYQDAYELSSKMVPNSNLILTEFLAHKENHRHRYIDFEDRVIMMHSEESVTNRLTRVYEKYLS
jgi:hypothetical protein